MSQQSRTIRPLSSTDGAEVDAVVDLSLRAWAPVFASVQHVLGATIFDRLYRPDWRAAQADAVRRTCLAEGSETWVVTEGGSPPVAFMVLRREPDESMGVVEMVAVDPERQRRGHATALMELAVATFGSEGLAVVNVGTGGDPGHAPARALYASVGFTALPVVAYFRALD